ncbi:MAG: CotH kinase family protein, partial [Ruminococcus sp.]
MSSYGSMTKVSDNLFMAEITYDPAVGMIGFSNANMHTYGDYYGNSAVVVKDYTGTDSLNNLVTLKSDTVSTSYTNYYDYELGTYSQEVTQPSSEETTVTETTPTTEETTTTTPVITDTVKATAFSDAMWIDTQPEVANTKVALIKAYEGSSGYRFYLPSGIDRSNLTIYHSFSSLSINGTTITSGNTYDMSNWANTTCSVNDTSKSFKIYQSTAKSFYMYTYSTAEDGTKSDKNLPTSTDSSLTSKSSVSEKGSYLVVDNNGTVTQAEDTLGSVKGRGNSSWEASYKLFGKYAYNIKLNTAIKLGGSDSTKSKKWCLLANNADEAMMRNTLVYNLADSIGLEDSPMSDIYDVYNNGNYLGSYQIAEKVEVSSKNALIQGANVDDMNEDANPDYDFDNPSRSSSNGSLSDASTAGYYKYCSGLTTPENYKDGDYLLEFELDERFPDEICGFISNRGQQVVLKTPEIATKDEVIYIMDRFNAAEAVAYAQAGSSTTSFARGSISTSNGKYTYTSSVSDYSVTVSSYYELIDGESFAQNYLIQEYVENLDGVATSFYVNLKNQDSLFTATPVWDFDWTMGQYGGSKKISSSQTLNPNNTDQWFIRYKAIYNNYDVDNLVTKLCKIDDFWSRVKIQWKYNVYPEIQKIYGSSGLIKNEYSNKLSASVAMNEDRYHFIANDPISSWGSANTGSTWSEAVSFVDSWASSRASWINNNIGTAVSYSKSGTSTQLTVDQTEDKSIVAEATPGTITADSTTLSNGDYTYEFTFTNGTETKTITQVGTNTVTLSDTATAGDVYTVSVSAYPTLAGKDTGFVLESDEVSYTVTESTDPKLTVSPTTLNLTVGDTSTLTAKAVNIEEAVTWSSDKESVATVENGVVTAVAEGTATITATAGGLSATCVVTVSEPVSSIITLYFTDNYKWGSVKAWIWNDTTNTNESASWPGKSCKKIGTNSQNQDIYSCTMDTSLYDSIIFANSDGSSKTQDIKGITLANDGTGYYITGSSSPYTVATYSVVTPAVKLSTSSVELMAGDEYTITPASSKGTLSYESSSTDVVTVDENGVVKAVAKGTATITVTATGTFETATATLAVTVNDKYTVTFKNYDGTVISTQKYDAGETVVVPTETPVKPADAQYTYTFSGWDKDIVETVNADATYTAVFTGTLNKYSVSVSYVNGTVTGCPTNDVDYGTSVTLKAQANEGYTFAGYYVGDTKVSSSSTYTFTVTGNTEVVAKFTQLPGSELKVQVVGGTGLKVKIGANGVETTQSIFYDNKDVRTGQYVTLTSTGIDGYDFLYWINESGKIVAYSE